MSGTEFGGDAHEGDTDVREADTPDDFIEKPAQPLAGDETRTAPGKIEQRQHAPAGEAQSEILERRQPSRGVETTRQGADRRAGNGAGGYAMLLQPFDDADMCPTARRAITQREPDGLPHLPIHPHHLTPCTEDREISYYFKFVTA